MDMANISVNTTADMESEVNAGGPGSTYAQTNCENCM